MAKTFREKVISRRMELEWTQDDLAEESGVSSGTIASIESGHSKNPSLDAALALSRTLGFSLDGLKRSKDGIPVVLEAQS